MTYDEARIILLEAALVQSHHTISFLYGCLESPEWHKHAYPEQTLDRIKHIESLVTIPEGCYHSLRKGDCPACAATIARNRLYHEALEIVKSRLTPGDASATVAP